LQRRELRLALSLGLFGGALCLRPRLFLTALPLCFFGDPLLLARLRRLLALAGNLLLGRSKKRSRRHKVKVFFERSALPRNLLAAGLAPHVQAHALEYVLDLGVRNADLPEQIFGIETVRPFAVGRGIAGCRRVREQRSRRRV